MRNAKWVQKYGTWAVVTGASEGIGRAFCRECGAAGLSVVAVARRAEKLEELARELAHDFGVQVRIVAADLGEAEGLERLIQLTDDLDVGLFIASAGYGTSGPLLDADLASEHNMLEVNCFALIHGCVAFGRRFRNRGRGGIILMSSLVGWQGTPLSAHYSATKAYVQSLAEALYLELKPLHIDVLASAPGPVSSGFAARANMQMGLATAPETVARATLRALAHGSTVVPGILSKVLTYALWPLPRQIRSRVMGLVMSGMTRHQKAVAA